MRNNERMRQASGLALAGAIAAFGMAACQKAGPVSAEASAISAPPAVATLPLTDAATQPMAMAPPVNALPSAPVGRVRVARPMDRYAFSDRANRAGYGFGDAPPDYSFDYQGVRPWAWQGQNGYQTVVEPLPGGGDRYYYYQPGSNQPYLVRDPQYAYGYQNGSLAVVYDRSGRPLPDSYIDQRSGDAGRYLYRALALYAASRAEQHQAVARDDWYARRAHIDAERQAWQASQQRDQQWAAYHDQYDQQYGTREQPQWAAERERREAWAAQIDAANNNAQAAARERQAAQSAQAQAALNAARGQGYPSQYPGQIQNPGQNPYPGRDNQGRQGPFGPPPMQGQPQGPNPAQGQAEAQARAQSQAQALAAQQAQLRAAQTGQAQAEAQARRAQIEAQAAQQSQIRAQQAAQAQNAAQAQREQAQAQARRQAQAQAQMQAQAREAQRTQAAAVHQAELQAQSAQRQAEQHAAQQAQQQAAQEVRVREQAAHQAEMQAQAAQRQAEQRTAQQAQQAARQQTQTAFEVRARNEAASQAAQKAAAEKTAAEHKAKFADQDKGDRRGKEAPPN